MIFGPRAARRRTDRRVGALAAATVRSLIGRLDPVAGGRFLLLLSGGGVALGSALLGPSAHDWKVLIGVSAVMAALLLLSTLVEWGRFPQHATAAFPLATLGGMATLGVLTPYLTGALTGLLTGVFLYTGLTQRRGSSVWVVPAGMATFAVMNGAAENGLTGAVAVRLLIGALMWTTVVEILAAFTEEQQRLTRALTTAATSDALTGIPNRRDLETRLSTVLVGDAVVVCDLDHFKLLNDTHGHHVGDETLAAFGALLRLQLRAGDYCARFGGEEFVLVLPGTEPGGALAVVQRLRTAWQLLEPATTFSAGIAVCRPDRDATHTLVAADAALYEAKAAGRNAICVEPQVSGQQVPQPAARAAKVA